MFEVAHLVYMLYSLGMTFSTRKYETFSFDEIQVGDWIQRKTPSGSRFSNMYIVTDITTFPVGEKNWEIVHCDKKIFIKHQETGNTFRKIL